uniref:DENN domain containing 3 n=1 Tax=Panthera tigris altaica TaxID=74533 RepID=A0A8C9JBJ5_PANTA
KREKPKTEPWKGPPLEDISVPNGVDLLALPQLCFPGGVCVASEPKEDSVHFLVLTDVCGNRTYGVVAQYYRPLHDESCFYNGKMPPGGAAGCFVPFAVCVVSRFPYYNALKDCLSCLLIHLKLCKDFEVDNHIKDFAAKLSLIPSPPPGPLHLVMKSGFGKPFPEMSFLPLFLHLRGGWGDSTQLLGCGSYVYLQVQILTSIFTHSQEADGLILINIDNGSVTYSNDEDIDVPDIPLLAAQTFIQREVKNHLNYEHRVFNSEEFLKTRAPGDQQFYKQVRSTWGSWASLYSERFQNTFSQKLSRMLPSPRRPTIEKMASRNSPSLHVTHRRMVVSMPNLRDIAAPELPARNSSLRKMDSEGSRSSSTVPSVTPKATCSFKVPEIHFPLVSQCVQAYYSDCVGLLSKAMSLLAPDNSVLLARYFYLRGAVHLMQGQLLDALLDFQSLYKTDIRIFPADLVRRTVESMSGPERARAERVPELRRLISEVVDKPGEAPKPDDRVKNFELPKKHMQLDDFVKRVQESGIVKDTNIINRLFEALTVGHQKQIDPETFKDFYNCWKEAEAEAQEVSLPSSVMEHLDKNECVYKLSSSVKTNRGVGKIAMTQKRLFLLTEGRPGYVEISTFRDIEEVRSTTVAFLLLRIPTLKIKTASKQEVFEANLKTECDVWHLMVKEMWAGKKLADDHKDPQYIQQALTHVLLMDAVVGTLQSPGAIYAASKLSYFDKMRNEMMAPVTCTCIQGFPFENVFGLFTSSGHLDPAEKVEDAHPKLWCALSEGKVIVFDASSWTIHQHCFRVGTSKLNCMAMVEQSQVWVAFAWARITVHAVDLYLMVTSLASVSSVLHPCVRTPSKVYSCSVDGTVLAWNVSSLRVTSRLQLPGGGLSSIRLHDGCLWCCKSSENLDSLEEEHKEGHNNATSIYFFQALPKGNCSHLLDCPCGSRHGSRPVRGGLDLGARRGLPAQARRRVADAPSVSPWQIWVGGTGRSQGKYKGKIYVIDAQRKTVEKELVAHTDAVKTLCSAEDRYVLSGSGSGEGKIAIWKVE